MSSIASILIGAAASAGAPIVKSILEKHVGGQAGAIGGAVIDAIAGHAGAPPQDLGRLPPAQLEAAVRAAEADAAELVLAQVEQQREANRLMTAEMEKGSAWTWAWRPATMWILIALWIWSIVAVPIVNAIAGAAIPLFLAELTFLTMTYIGLYMGGHTAKEIAGKWAETRRAGGIW